MHTESLKVAAARRRRVALLLTAATGAAALALAVAWREERVTAPDALTLVPVARLGAEQEDTRGDGFGLVADIAVDGRGRAYVLDGRKLNVTRFTPEGLPLGAYGREGNGPGELAIPVAIAVDSAGRTYVLDQGNARISIFEGERFAGSFPLDFDGEDLCLVHGRLYVLGEREGRLIHEIEPRSGAVLRSFAPDSTARDPLLRGNRASGYLGCAERDDLVFLPLFLPEVRRYHLATGAPAGTEPIPGYRAVQVRRHGRSVTFENPEGGPHHVGAAVAPIDGGWLVQIGFLDKGARTQHELEIDRSFLQGAHGGLRPVTETPRLLATRGERAYAAVNAPYPQVHVFALSTRIRR